MKSKGNEKEAKINRVLSSEEIKRLTDLFSILIEIDKRLINSKRYGKNN